MRRHRLLPALLSISLLALFACGDNNNNMSCDAEAQDQKWAISGCPAALLFAARDTANLLPSRPELDRYLDRWRRTIAAEPILTTSIPQRYRIHDASISVDTTNPRFIEAWTRRVLETGDVELDEMLADLEVTLGPVRDLGPHYNASLETTYIFNEELLAAALLARASWIPEPAVWPREDGTWVWLDSDERAGNDEATAKIDFRFGWGDCFSGCLGFRNLQAIVPADGPVTVYDLGGDPLPPYLTLSPNTKPPP